ncbi:MAG: alpha/beta fold hydrolase [Alphaproteobacteria bacterium]
MAKSARKITFTGSLGEALDARLDMPSGPPRAYALFAHCFSCSKDVRAAAFIAGALAERGIAVLRFDFTGLGNSEGDFANTNFSSNVGDLVRAADHLRENFQAPAILIGHSFGGAAALMAAREIPECRAVATIAAPADTAHVTHNFRDSIPEIDRLGEAEVSLAGRPFRIRKQFLDDLERHEVTQAASGLRRALLVCHAPLDTLVSIDNATEIFVAAKHPKSFLSLDDADHLLSRKQDAAYVAGVIAVWAGRYVDLGTPASTSLPDTEEKHVTVRERRQGAWDALIAAGPHRMLGDQPEQTGGLALGPDPYSYLAASLGLCTTQTLRMYAGRKGLKLDRVTVHLRYDKVYSEDCEGCVEGKGRKRLTLWRNLQLEGELTDAERQRLVEIADRCPVHRSLQEKTPIHTALQED